MLGGRVPFIWSGARAGLIGWSEPELALLELARAFGSSDLVAPQARKEPTISRPRSQVYDAAEGT